MLRNKDVAATGLVMASCVLVGVVLQARESKSAGGSCAKYDGCCHAGFCKGDMGDQCYCDTRCLEFGDCCSDMHCEEPSSVVSPSTLMRNVSSSVTFPGSTESPVGPDTTSALLPSSDVVDTEITIHPGSISPFFIVVLAACAIGVLLVGVVILILSILVCVIKKRRRQRAQSPKSSPSHIYHTVTPEGKLTTKSLRKDEVENIYDDIKGISAKKSTEFTVNVSYTHMTSNTAYGDVADNVAFTQSTDNPTYKQVPTHMTSNTAHGDVADNVAFTQIADNPTYKQVPNTYTYVTRNNVYEHIPENNAYEHIPGKNTYANVIDCPPYAHVADNVGYASVADNVAY